MKYIYLTALVFFGTTPIKAQETSEKIRWEKHVKNTTIIRDEWGIAHIYGKTDADAVFGLMYAQCEENFDQIEKNYLEMLGRRSEAEGGSVFYDDLMMRLIQDSVDAIHDYNKSPIWFKEILQAHADGLNYYLYKHPKVHPVVLFKFKPWYHLMWTDGSVSPTRTGGIKVNDVANFYKININDSSAKATAFNESRVKQINFLDRLNDPTEKTLKGSNGFAIAPAHSKNGNALLYINPHVPFYFRSEMHMVSEQGLNVYGAVTWGQLFIYQGFNEHLGWMHTSSYADVADVYEEKVMMKDNHWFYFYENEWKPVIEKIIPIKYGAVTKNIKTYYTAHGPVMGSKNEKWLSLRENNRSLNALMECWTRTKAKNLKEYQKALSLLANNSNNTVYADADGHIAYWHGNFMPKRNNQYDFSNPVDGTIQATNWQGVHALEDIVQSIDPINGWLQNCNATPFTVAGKNSPDPQKYPMYMAPDGENPRGLNAVRLLEKINKLDLNDLIKIGYDKHLTAFDTLLPGFITFSKSYSLSGEERKAIEYLENWNHDADTNSIAQTIAIEWATLLVKDLPLPKTEEEGTRIMERYQKIVRDISNPRKLILLSQAINYIKKQYGEGKRFDIPWGQINKYQRASKLNKFPFDDNKPSISVAQTSSKWGQLPAFESKPYHGVKNRYGFSGNSFVAAVSFGKKLVAKTIITGGQGTQEGAAHFTDQAQRYIEGNFKTIHFYKNEVMAHQVSAYQPGKEK